MVLIVHHLQVSQSERIPWLCEELGIDYELKTYQRAPLFAPPEYKALHAMGAAPVIQDGDLTLAESCACIEYICHKYGNGKLFLHPDDEGYAEFLYWWHWADGSFQPAIMRSGSAKAAGMKADSPIATLIKNRDERTFGMLEKRLGQNKWLAGDVFTAADIMIVFPLTTNRYFYPYALEKYPNIVDYLERISQRKGYREAMKKSDPGLEFAVGVNPPKSNFQL
jgi:glutathione S-transferase